MFFFKSRASKKTPIVQLSDAELDQIHGGGRISTTTTWEQESAQPVASATAYRGIDAERRENLMMFSADRLNRF